MRFKAYIILLIIAILCSLQIEAKQKPIDSLKALYDKKSTPDSLKLGILSDIAYEFFNDLNYDSAIYYNNLIIKQGSAKPSKALLGAFYDKGRIYVRIGKPDSALNNYQNALKIAKTINDKNNIPFINNAIGSVYKSLSNYIKAIEYYQNNLKIAEEAGDSVFYGNCLNNIANVYSSFGIISKSIEFYNKALNIYSKTKKYDYLGFTYLNLGMAYRKQNNFDKALENYENSLRLFNSIKLIRGIAQSKSELGSLYSELGDQKKAVIYLTEAFNVYMQLGEENVVAGILQDIGISYKKLGNYNLALNYLKQSLDLSVKMEKTEAITTIYRNIADVYSKMGNFYQAYENFKVYSTLKDTLLNNSFLKQMQEMEAKYEKNKMEKEIQLKNADLDKKNIEAKRQKIMLYGVALIALLVLAFTFALYRQFAEKKRANVLLAEQNDKIMKQRDQIFQQKKEITDSIHYASRIQRAVLPSAKTLDDFGLQHFILYKPRDIVSGDFYWINQKDHKLLIAAADCTGHGVPGAFMSMLGMAFLNEIVTKGDFDNPAQILDQLRNLVVKSLHQSGKMEETKDGMDMSLCMLDFDNMSCQFAGAFNPLYLVRGEELIEGGADRMPVGFHDRMYSPFSNTELKIQKGDALYIFSDGYVDQFGGENGKKFMAKKFKQLLTSFQNEAMDTQKEILERTIIDWRGELDQVDDILVIGVKI